VISWLTATVGRLKGHRRRVIIVLKSGNTMLGYVTIDGARWRALRAAASTFDPPGWASSLANPGTFAALPSELDLDMIAEGSSVELAQPTRRRLRVSRGSIAKIGVLTKQLADW
jgi:hypothetical protein